MINEAKLFSKATKESKFLQAALRKGSVSEQDAQNREITYQKVFSNYTDLKETAKAFSSYAESDVQANQYFDASVAAQAKSFAGFFTIERALDQPKALIYYLDLLGIDGTRVMPNIGAENINNGNIQNRASATQAVTPGSTHVFNLNKQLVPGTVKLTLGTFTAQDDRQGGFLASPGLLATATVNYSTGRIDVVLGAAAANTGSLVVVSNENQTAVQKGNRFKTELSNYLVETYPEMLVGESNLVALAAMRKSLGIDVQAVIVGKLQELYTKLINQEIVGQLISAGTAGSIAIQVNDARYQDYRSSIDTFVGELNAVDTALGVKSVKGTKATAYVCGKDMITMFKKTKMNGQFVEAEQAYVNDLVGYYNGVPVLEHTSVAANAGIAVHKTSDGNLAPVARGIFLPLTSTPTIGNYDNPTQQATGVFYQQKSQLIVPELVQHFTLAA